MPRTLSQLLEFNSTAAVWVQNSPGEVVTISSTHSAPVGRPGPGAHSGLAFVRLQSQRSPGSLGSDTIQTLH